MIDTANDILENPLVKCTIHKKPACQIELETLVSKELSSQTHDRAVKTLSKGVNIPGFRKGKAPESIILERFPQELKKYWQEFVVQVALQESLKLTSLEPLDKEKISFKVVDLSTKGTILSFFFEVAPTIPAIDPKQYKAIEVKRPAVNEETVKETIRQSLFFYATWDKAPEDTEIKEGDFVLLDVDLTEVTPPSSLFRNTRFEIVDKSMAQWMKQLLIGKKAGDVVEGISVPDEDADPLEKELKPQKVQITIKAIEVPTLPELTSDLLKTLGANSEEDLKAKVEKLLNDQADQHVKEKQRDHVREFLLQQYPFDLPASLVNKEMQFRVNQLNRTEEFLKHWRSLSQEDQQKTIQIIQSQSEKAVKLFHLCNKIAQDHNLTTSPYSIPKPVETQIEALINPNQMLNYHGQPELQRAEILSKLILERAEDYIIAHSTTNVVA